MIWMVNDFMAEFLRRKAIYRVPQRVDAQVCVDYDLPAKKCNCNQRNVSVWACRGPVCCRGEEVVTSDGVLKALYFFHSWTPSATSWMFTLTYVHRIENSDLLSSLSLHGFFLLSFPLLSRLPPGLLFLPFPPSLFPPLVFTLPFDPKTRGAPHQLQHPVRSQSLRHRPFAPPPASATHKTSYESHSIFIHVGLPVAF